MIYFTFKLVQWQFTLINSRNGKMSAQCCLSTKWWSYKTIYLKQNFACCAMVCYIQDHLSTEECNMCYTFLLACFYDVKDQNFKQEFFKVIACIITTVISVKKVKGSSVLYQSVKFFHTRVRSSPSSNLCKNTCLVQIPDKLVVAWTELKLLKTTFTHCCLWACWCQHDGIQNSIVVVILE